MKKSSVLNLEILGAPIGDLIFCAKFVARKRVDASKLLQQLVDVGTVDPQVALLLLRECGGFCKMAHLARSPPPPPSSAFFREALHFFDEDVHRCFSECTVIDTANVLGSVVWLNICQLPTFYP